MNENLMKLKKMLCKELEEYGGSGNKLSAGTLDVVDKLAHCCKNVCKIIESEDEMEYSCAGSYRRSYADGMGGSYDDGMGGSYADGMSRRGSYRRRRDSMGRYSSDGGYSRTSDNAELHELVDQLRAMSKDFPQHTQRAIQEFAESVD